MSPTKPTLHIGVMAEEAQLSDIMGIDVFGNISTDYIQEVVKSGIPIPPSILEQTIPVKFYYLASNLSVTHMTPSLRFVPNCTYDDAPRDLDILLIAGVLPPFNSPGADKFLKEQKSKIIFTTCIGAMWFASAGGLVGKKATTNRSAIPMCQKMCPETEWLDQRWVVDGNVWTSGGAGAGEFTCLSVFHCSIDTVVGIDMIVAYARQTFPALLLQTLVIDALEFDDLPRGQFYPDNPKGKAAVGDLKIPYWANQKKIGDAIAAASKETK
jgi:putative intracellular protease/amidase